MLVIVAAAVAWTWYGSRAALPAMVKTAGQNVLLITIDTLRADAIGSYGGRAATPNLDALGRRGIRFTFAHAHAVMTLPSHASILTGRYPFEHGARDNAGFRLDDSALTLAEMLRARGFSTGAFVGAFPLDRRFGLAQGFDVYDDVGGREVAQADFKFTERRAGEVVAAARNWIEAQAGPWLAWVHVFDPHAPYAPPAPFDRDYAADPYAGEVAYTDRALGPLLDVAAAGPRPTTVIVTADHGEALGDHGEQTHGVFAYESTLRVPLIVAQVGSEARERPQGTISDAAVAHVDILPTVADLLDFGPPDALPGRSLLSIQAAPADSRATYFESMAPMLTRGWAPLTGVLVGRHKYIDLPLEELYDLAADPLERQNLVATVPGVVRQLASRLSTFGGTLPEAPVTEHADARARLRALGYASGSARRKAQYSEDDDPKRLIELEVMMSRGLELHQRGRYEEAVTLYDAIVSRRPAMNLAYRRLASIHWAQGHAAAAIATLEQALERNGPDLETEVRLATYLAEAGAPVRAIAMLRPIVEADPSNTEALNGLGVAYAHEGRHADALRQFERVLAADPRDAFALENLGTVHLQQGKLDEAQRAFRQAILADPESSRAHAGLGVAASKAGRAEEAIDHWRTAVRFDRTNYDALFNLSTELVNAGRFDEARPYLEQFVRTAPPGLYGVEIQRLRDLLIRTAPGKR